MRQGFLKQTSRLEASEAEAARMAEWARGTEAAVRELRGKVQEGEVHTHTQDLIQNEVSRLLGSHLALGAAPGVLTTKTPLGFPVSHPFEVDQRVTSLEREVHRLTQVDASWDSQLQRLEQRVPRLPPRFLPIPLTPHLMPRPGRSMIASTSPRSMAGALRRELGGRRGRRPT